MGFEDNNTNEYTYTNSLKSYSIRQDDSLSTPVPEDNIPEDITSTTKLYDDSRLSRRIRKKISMVLFLIVLAVGLWYLKNYLKAYTENYQNEVNSKFKVKVEVIKYFQPGEYYDTTSGTNNNWITIDKPVMKCKIIEVDRNDYQKTHTIEGEPHTDDIIYITETHGDYFSQGAELDFIIKDSEITDGQFEMYALNECGLDGQTVESDLNINTITAAPSDVYITSADIETYIQDKKNWIPDDQEGNIQAYLEEKYNETGIRMYIIFFNTNDTSYMDSYLKAIMSSIDGPAISYTRNANDNSWHMWWVAPSDTVNEKIKNNMSKVNEAYLIYGTYEDRLKYVIDTAYGMYE